VAGLPGGGWGPFPSFVDAAIVHGAAWSGRCHPLPATSRTRLSFLLAPSRSPEPRQYGDQIARSLHNGMPFMATFNKKGEPTGYGYV
jgi:hypothetical protein